MHINPDFSKAIKYYNILLEEGFPQKAILKLVGDRYRLSSVERTLLYRGVCAKKDSIHRRSKIALVKDVKNKTIHIDGYNIFITIGSYLNGNLVFLGYDNFLRDSAEVHGKKIRKELLNRSIFLVFDYLKKIKANKVQIYLDNPVSNSGDLAMKLNEDLESSCLQGYAETVNSPDFLLKEINKGIIATSDSTIIDKCQVPVLDLARKVLSYHFKPSFFKLR